MQLRAIDKKIYRNHLRKTTFAAIFSLLCGSLILSTVLIHFIGNDTQSNFNLNLASIIVTIILMLITLLNVKRQPFFAEMYYVWRVKFELSHINRKMTAVENAAKSDNHLALNILAYYYQATEQIWLLDDNTVAMEEFVIKENKVKKWMANANHTPDVTVYNRVDLQQF